MKRTVGFGALLLLTAFAESLYACGDKFLVVGRGARFQRGYVATNPGSILVVENGKSAKNELLLPLRRAGHKTDVVRSADEIRTAVAANEYDVVLADWSQESEVSKVVSASSPSVTFLPVLDGASKEELNEAAKKYACPLESKNARMTGNFLARLDEVIEAKRKERPLDCEVK